MSGAGRVRVVAGRKNVTRELLMRRVAAAFERGDLDPLFCAIDENIVWKSAVTIGGSFSFGGVYNKVDGVVELMSGITTEYFFRKFRPREIFSSTEMIWGLFDVQGEYRPLGVGFGRPFEYECAIHWRVKGKKIIEHQTFFDTNSLLRQQSVGLPTRFRRFAVQPRPQLRG